ncbi:MAG: ArsR family transcriptional regulator, lead/cadmium/zinc/bismuth-responsive transcriptional [Chloroflexota bacterium]|jgi:ArsR family transcriptional regulator|nr:ArsR family transcriptional regulator, lead/cadmium/zinc/bismuth-responsive transcriptional [Chloroflexota bacterium]
MAQVLTIDQCDTVYLHPDAVRPLIGRLLSADAARATANWFDSLADPTRARILQALALAPELCVCDLALVLDLSVSALSHQLRLLRERGAVTRRKAGRIAFYSLADQHVRHVLADALAHTAEPESQTV